MAGELSLGYSMSLSKSGAVLTRSYSGSLDVSGRPYAAGQQLVTLAGEYADLGTVTAFGYVAVRHISDGSTANYLYVGESGANKPFALKPGEWVEGRWNLAAVHVIPDVGQCYFEYAVVST